MLDSRVSFWNEDLQDQVGAYNNIGAFNLSTKNLLFIKIFSKYQDPPKKQKIMRWLATVFYSVAFIILFLEFVAPININEKVGTSITILSSSLLFLSIWLVDKQQERKAQWDEVQMAAMLLNDMNEQIWADTELENFPLYCPKCRQESLIDAKDLQVTVIKRLEDKARS